MAHFFLILFMVSPCGADIRVGSLEDIFFFITASYLSGLCEKVSGPMPKSAKEL